jgi:hypothetical protein
MRKEWKVLSDRNIHYTIALGPAESHLNEQISIGQLAQGQPGVTLYVVDSVIKGGPYDRKNCCIIF